MKRVRGIIVSSRDERPHCLHHLDRGSGADGRDVLIAVCHCACCGILSNRLRVGRGQIEKGVDDVGAGRTDGCFYQVGSKDR